MQSSTKTTIKLALKRIKHDSADLGDHERLDLASMRNVRPDTQINHWPTTVNGGRRTIGNLGLDEVFLVLVVLSYPDRSACTHERVAPPTYAKHLQEILL